MASTVDHGYDADVEETPATRKADRRRRNGEPPAPAPRKMSPEKLLLLAKLREADREIAKLRKTLER
ncbi:hypothetical protein SLS58_006324 [Diplodia intermedia]|uniref:SyrB-like regulator n=1 Tax=Diplodia intermedia TaxID=856260 RepID=A0ABR3TND2_9PEZI